MTDQSNRYQPKIGDIVSYPVCSMQDNKYIQWTGKVVNVGYNAVDILGNGGGKIASRMISEIGLVYRPSSVVSTCDEDTQPIIVDEVDTLLLDDLKGEG